MTAEHGVVIVVGPGFAADVRRIARDRHVWAIRAPEYQRVADEERRRSSRHSLERGVTLFDAANASPEDEVISIFGTVEEHHGEYSHAPPLDEVEILGAEPTADVQAELRGFGFANVVASGRGFVASRGHGAEASARARGGSGASMARSFNEPARGRWSFGCPPARR